MEHVSLTKYTMNDNCFIIFNPDLGEHWWKEYFSFRDQCVDSGTKPVTRGQEKWRKIAAMMIIRHVSVTYGLRTVNACPDFGADNS